MQVDTLFSSLPAVFWVPVTPFSVSMPVYYTVRNSAASVCGFAAAVVNWTVLSLTVYYSMFCWSFFPGSRNTLLWHNAFAMAYLEDVLKTETFFNLCIIFFCLMYSTFHCLYCKFHILTADAVSLCYEIDTKHCIFLFERLLELFA